MLPPPHALVLGATGYVGRALIAELRRRGAEVTAHVRPDPGRDPAVRRHLEELGVRVEEVPWEVDALTALAERARPSHVFFLVGTTRARARRAGPGRDESYDAVDRGLLELTLAACRALEPAPRFLYLSSLGTSPRARGAYLRARWAAEEAVRASGFPYTIARPGLIHGPNRDERRLAEALAARLARAWAWTASHLGAVRHAARIRPFDSRELAYGLVHAAFNYTTIGRVLMAEELRYEIANDREYHVPRTRRDELRH